MVLVTGATGFLGAYLVQELLSAGYPVRVLVRNPQHAALASWQNKVEVAVGDVQEVIGLQQAMKGCTQVVHAAALVSFNSRDKELMRQVNALGTANVVNVALEAGISKLLYVSSVAALGGSPGAQPITEQSNAQQAVRKNYYGYTKLLGEMHVLRGVEEGLAAVICNPAVVVGPGGWASHSSPRLVRRAAKGLPLVPAGVNGFVGVWDVAKAVRLLLESDYQQGERFILVAENMPYKLFFEQLTHALGSAPPRWVLPTSMALLAGSILGAGAKLLGMNTQYGREQLRTISSEYRYDSGLFQTSFGFGFEPMKSILERTAAAYLQEHRKTKQHPVH